MKHLAATLTSLATIVAVYAWLAYAVAGGVR